MAGSGSDAHSTSASTIQWRGRLVMRSIMSMSSCLVAATSLRLTSNTCHLCGQ